MSNRWPGGVIRKTPVTPAGPFQNGAASGVWSLADAAYWTKQGLWPIAGNAQTFVEDVFSTYLYTGNGASSQTVTTNVNLASGGGLVWQKGRNAVSGHLLFDTTRNDTDYLSTNSTASITSFPGRTLAIGTSGFTVGSDTFVNGSGSTFATWSFKKSSKFFDLVTWSGNGTNRAIAHSLGVAPGCIFVKRTDNGFVDWQVYHRSNANTQYMVLNSTAAVATGATRWNSTTATATEFTVGTDATVNASGATYVAYLFAHDTASTGLIQCGSYAGTGVAGQIATLGWEPQWVMIKATNTATDWQMYDTMRGMTTLSDGTVRLNANTSGAESGPFGGATSIFPTATGFGAGGGIEGANQGGGNYIYVAIRRGPMRTPTLGTSVFNATFGTGGGTPWFKAGFPVDFGLFPNRSAGNQSWNGSRLTGETYMAIVSSAAEASDSFQKWDYMNGYRSDTTASTAYIGYSFRRAPGFFDEVCYTGTGANLTLNHNLGAAPELIIIKRRNSTGNWPAITQFTATTSSSGWLKESDGFFRNLAYGAIGWIGSQPTATTFSILTDPAVNTSGGTYVSYLFASAPGVSKVGSYTGNGSSQTINCAFTTGSRFVMIKRTDTTGDWYVWDSTRGIVAGNDPYLALNSTAAEVTSNDSVDTDNTGFIVNQVAASNVNVNGATYIFLAIA